MGISRFEQFAPVDFNDMPIVTPDVAMIDSMLGQFQGEYDQGVSKFSEANFKNLGADAITAQQLRQAQNQMVDDISEKYVKGVGEGRQAMSQGLRDLTRDYKEGGQRYAINKNYESFMAQRADLQKRVGLSEAQGGITQDQMAAWEQYTLGNFGKKGGTAADEYGIWGSIAMDDVAKHVNGNLRALEIAKDWKANKVSTGQWIKDGEIYRKNTKGKEEVTFEEIMDETLKAMARDGELTNYLKQYGEHSGRPYDLSNFGTTNEDGSVTYNTDNPLVGYAMTAAHKFSYLDKMYDEDIKFDEFEKQRLQWGREDEKERLKNLMDTTVHLGRSTVKTDVYETAADARKGISEYDRQIKTYEDQLKNTKDLSESQRGELEELILKTKYDKLNLEEAYNTTVNEVAPEYSAFLKQKEQTLKSAGINASLHNTAMDAVSKGLVITQFIPGSNLSPGSGTAVNSGSQALSTGNIQKAAEIYSKTTGVPLTQAMMILGNELTTRDMQPRVDKAVKTKIEVSKKNNAIAQPMIAHDRKLKHENGDLKGVTTAYGKLVNQLQSNPEGFNFSHPDVGVHSGEDFYKAMEDQYGGKFEWTTMTPTDYIPGSDFMADGKLLKANNKEVVKVKHTDENGTVKYVTFTAGFTKATQSFADEVENDILNFSIDEDSKRAIQVGNAKKEKPIGMFARMETGNQKKGFIPGALQPGQDPTKVYGGVEFEWKPGNNKGVSDAYIVKVGDFKKDFGNSYMEAERWGDKMVLISKAMSQYPTIDEAVNSMWSQLKDQPDNPLTKEDLIKAVTHFKQR